MAYDQRSLDDYIDVAQRIADFRERFPEGTIAPWNPAEPWRLVQAMGYDKDGSEVMQSFVVVVAAAYRTLHDPNPGVGMAWEIFPGRTNFTRGSELQNAETSAWGRAIIAVGASDSKRGIASREEVRNRQAERDDGLPRHDHQIALDENGLSIRVAGCPACLPRNADGSLSRSRTSDEQKAAAGVMTDAEQRAHNALRREGEPELDRIELLDGKNVMAITGKDLWYDSPKPLADVENPEDRHGTATADQIRSLQARFAAIGVTDRDAKIAHLQQMFGAGVHSSKDLSYTQAAQALQELTR